MSRASRVLVVAAAALLVLALVLQLHGRSRPSATIVLADPVRTPGVINADVTQANIATTICRRGYTRTIRPPVEYTNVLKLRQMHAYGEKGSPSQYQEDHLVSLELGGHPTDPRNLWPEPYPRAAEVDRIENELNARVCSGSLSLAAAQKQESALKHAKG